MTPLDVIGWPLVLVQRPLLSPSAFAVTLRDRGVYMGPDDLELLDRARLLSPLYAVRRPRWDVNRRLRATNFNDLYGGRSWSVPERGPELAEDFAAGLVVDGAHRRFRAWATDEVRTKLGTVRRTEYLYSRYQAISGTWLAEAVPLVRRSRRELNKWDRVRLRQMRRRAERDRALVPVLTALEPAHLPDIVRTYRFTAHDVPDERERFLASFDPVALLVDLGWTTEELYQAASRLMLDADRVDPLAEWLPLVRLVRPDRWDKLRGGALLAIDLRIGGDMLLKYLEALQEKGAALPFPSVPKLERHELNMRLRPGGSDLDDVLMTYGLSPYPAVLLALEGATEMTIAPLVMKLLGIPTRDSFIRLLDSGGETRDHGLLASYVALPKLGPRRGDTAPFLRPPTRYVIAVDGDRKFRTASARELERAKWATLLFNGLPAEVATAAAREDVADLVFVEVWGDRLDFERAHFTDLELAVGLFATGLVPAGVTVSDLERDLEVRRAAGESIKKVWEGWPIRPEKPDLARTLWPVLESRILERLDDDTRLNEIPIVRVLLKAFDLALRTPRGHAVLRVDSRATD